MKKTFVLPIISVMILMVTLMAASVYADLATNSPTVCSGSASPWTTCGNAFGNNINQSTAAVTGTVNRTSQWRNYGFTIPGSASVNSVKVRADFWASRTSGSVNIKVSTDGGNTWGPNHVVGGNTAEQTFTIDVTSDFTWTPSKLNNSNLRINATCFKVGGGTNPTCRLDWVPVNVTYTAFDFSVSANPSSSSVAQARNATSVVSVNLVSGSPQSVTLSQSGCPTGATCNFVPSSGTPSYNSTLTVATSASTPEGTYNINVTGTGDGKTRSAVYTVNVTDSQPVASASANPTSGIRPLTVNFTGGVTGGDAPLTYFWNFKDGTNSTQQNPQHVYNTAGAYNATFTATDFDGDQSMSSVLVTVNEACVRNYPTVSITPSIQSGTNGSTLDYNTSVTNNDNGACGGSTFNMSQSIPPGDWNAVFSNSSFVIMPSVTQTVMFSLTSAANATGSNVFYNMALNTASGYEGSGWAEYNVTG